MRPFILFLIFIFGLNLGAQEMGFQLKKEEVRIPFKWINNLILIPVEVNGRPLTFLLDTGASATILYGNPEKDRDFSEIQKLSFSGTGVDGDIESLKTVGNTVSIGDSLVDDNHTIYIISGENLDFLNYIDVPINGSIGYHFFRNYPVKIDYMNRYLVIYKDRKRAKLSKFEMLPIEIEMGQPYLNAEIKMTTRTRRLKLLLDSGNNDALWLFPLYIKDFTEKKPNMKTVLGRGTHGLIRGKKSRINAFYMGSFEIEKPILSTPDANSLRYLKTIATRKGSIGNEILKRFQIILDYPQKKMYIQRNRNFNLPFFVNKSGLKVQYAGFVWTPPSLKLLLSNNPEENQRDTLPNKNESFNFTYTLIPQYSITSCKKSAPCYSAGIRKGDKVVAINGEETNSLNLSDIEKHFFDKDGTYINLKVQRGSKILNLGFRLKDPIPYK